MNKYKNFIVASVVFFLLGYLIFYMNPALFEFEKDHFKAQLSKLQYIFILPAVIVI